MKSSQNPKNRKASRRLWKPFRIALHPIMGIGIILFLIGILALILRALDIIEFTLYPMN